VEVHTQGLQEGEVVGEITQVGVLLLMVMVVGVGVEVEDPLPVTPIKWVGVGVLPGMF
jgi:hypothetical protein